MKKDTYRHIEIWSDGGDPSSKISIPNPSSRGAQRADHES